MRIHSTLSVYVVWEGQLCSAGVRVRVTEPHDAGLHEDSFKTELARIPHADTHPSALMKLEGGCDPAAPVQTRRSAHLQVLVISCLDYRKLLLPPDLCSPTHIQVETPVVHHLYGHRGVPFWCGFRPGYMSLSCQHVCFTSYQYQYTVRVLKQMLLWWF